MMKKPYVRIGNWGAVLPVLKLSGKMKEKFLKRIKLVVDMILQNEFNDKLGALPNNRTQSWHSGAKLSRKVSLQQLQEA